MTGKKQQIEQVELRAARPIMIRTLSIVAAVAALAVSAAPVASAGTSKKPPSARFLDQPKPVTSFKRPRRVRGIGRPLRGREIRGGQGRHVEHTDGGGVKDAPRSARAISPVGTNALVRTVASCPEQAYALDELQDVGVPRGAAPLLGAGSVQLFVAFACQPGTLASPLVPSCSSPLGKTDHAVLSGDRKEPQKARNPPDLAGFGLFRWSGRWGSNPRPSAWEADALPTELRPRGTGF